MNHNHGVKKVLATAACISCITVFSSIQAATAITIGSNRTATASAGSLTVVRTSSGRTTNYTWLDGDSDSVTINLTSGTLTVSDYSSSVVNGIINATGGSLYLTSGTLTISSDSIIESAVTASIAEGTLSVTGGEVTLDSDDTWNGTVEISDGTLALDSVTKSSSGIFTQTGGETTITGTGFDLNNEDDEVSGGTLNIGDGSVTSDLTVSEGTIESGADVNITSKGTLSVTGGEVTLDSDDTWNGTVEISDGTLNLTDGLSHTTTSSSTFNQTGGTTNIDSSKLVLNTSDSVISGGTVNLTSSGKLVINNSSENQSELNSTGGTFTISGSSTYTTTGGTIDSDSEVTIESASKLTIDGDDAEVTLDSDDTVEGSIELNNGTLYISDNLRKVTDADGNYVQTGGTMTMSSSRLNLKDSGSIISGGSVNLTDNSTLTVSESGGSITGGNFTIDDTSILNYLSSTGMVQSDSSSINIDTSGLINMINDTATDSVINNLVINNSTGDGQADFAIDIYGRSSTDSSSDTITANSIQVATIGEDGTVYISDWNLAGDIFGYDAPIDKSIRLQIFNSDDIDPEVTFSATDKEIFTPIGYYRLNASSANDGSYTLDLTSLNPQVYRGQVATISSYMNQLVVNDTLFNRAHIRHYAQSFDEKFRNRTAILDANASYARTLKEGGLWTEVFGNFETLKMSHGLSKVRNNSWGFIVGGDFGLKELKNGWKWMPTAYIAYNGGHQTFNKVGMYENGAQLGFMSSFSKNNFMETGLVYAGLYGTDIDIAGTSEDAFNWFFGLASKTSYEWAPREGHFKIQPNLTLAYNLFGKQNWHADYGQMGMSSGFLNGFNIAPGVNFIWQQETWNIYAAIAYAWNLFGGIDGQAGNVDLPSLRMNHGYITYGFGMTKSFSDRLQMYAQATVRNIGRTGIICQGGLNWRL